MEWCIKLIIFLAMHEHNTSFGNATDIGFLAIHEFLSRDAWHFPRMHESSRDAWISFSSYMHIFLMMHDSFFCDAWKFFSWCMNLISRDALISLLTDEYFYDDTWIFCLVMHGYFSCNTLIFFRVIHEFLSRDAWPLILRCMYLFLTMHEFSFSWYMDILSHNAWIFFFAIHANFPQNAWIFFLMIHE